MSHVPTVGKASGTPSTPRAASTDTPAANRPPVTAAPPPVDSLVEARLVTARDRREHALGMERVKAGAAVKSAWSAAWGRPGNIHDTAPVRSASTGPSAPAGIEASIDELLALRRAGDIPEARLVNQHAVTRNNAVELYVDGTNAFPEILRALDTATDTIHLSFFIFENDALGNLFADKLIRAVQERGVEVKLMVDGFGAQLHKRDSPSRALMDRMEAGGVEVIRNHMVDVTRCEEVLNHPDHRKLVIIDGKVGFTGGMNVGDHYVSPYHDLMVRVEGDVVKQMQVEWLTSWLHLGGMVGKPSDSDDALRARFFPPTGTAPGSTAMKVAQAIPGEHGEIREVCLQKIREAKKSVYIENLYLSSRLVQDALRDAAKRGVAVHIILPAEDDQPYTRLAGRQCMPELIEAGCRIYEYPGYCHGKVLVVDDSFVSIGSSNFDDVALFHVYELNLNVEDEAFARECIKRIFEVDIAISHQVKASEITRRELVLGKVADLFSYYI